MLRLRSRSRKRCCCRPLPTPLQKRKHDCLMAQISCFSRSSSRSPSASSIPSARGRDYLATAFHFSPSLPPSLPVSSVIFAAKRRSETETDRQFLPSSPPFPGLQLRSSSSSSSSSCYIEEPILSYFSRAARTNSAVILNLRSPLPFPPLLSPAAAGMQEEVEEGGGRGGFGQR